MGVLSMPFLYESRAQKWEVLGSDVGQDLLATCEKADLYGVCFFEAGARSYYAKTPIRTMEDLQGLKSELCRVRYVLIRLMQWVHQPYQWLLVKSIVQSSQVLLMVMNVTILHTFSQSHYEVCPYFTFDEHVQIPDMLIASKLGLEKLTPTDRDIVLELGRNLWKTQLKAYEDNEQVAYDTLVDKRY